MCYSGLRISAAFSPTELTKIAQCTLSDVFKPPTPLKNKQTRNRKKTSLHHWGPLPIATLTRPHDNLVLQDERAGPWCEVPKPSEAARWHSGTEEAECCYLALQGCNNHHSMCVSVLLWG